MICLYLTPGSEKKMPNIDKYDVNVSLTPIIFETYLGNHNQYCDFKRFKRNFWRASFPFVGPVLPSFVLLISVPGFKARLDPLLMCYVLHHLHTMDSSDLPLMEHLQHLLKVSTEAKPFWFMHFYTYLQALEGLKPGIVCPAVYDRCATLWVMSARLCGFKIDIEETDIECHQQLHTLGVKVKIHYFASIIYSCTFIKEHLHNKSWKLKTHIISLWLRNRRTCATAVTIIAHYFL